MSKFYKVSPKWKKSIFEYQVFKDEEKGISCEVEEMYRWGHCIIKVDNDEELEDIIGDPNNANNEFEFDHTMVEDQEVDDQCSFEELEQKHEDESRDSLMVTVGEPTDVYTIYQGKLEVKEVTQ